MNKAFEARYHSDTKRAWAIIQLKAVRFANYHANNCSDREAFKEMIADVERLSSLAHDGDQSNHALCACLCTAFKGLEWTLYAKSKNCI